MGGGDTVSSWGILDFSKIISYCNTVYCYLIFFQGNKCTCTSMEPIKILFSGELLGLSTFETTHWDWRWHFLPVKTQKERRSRSCLGFSSCMHIYKNHGEQVWDFKQHRWNIFGRECMQLSSIFPFILLWISHSVLSFPPNWPTLEGENEFWLRS